MTLKEGKPVTSITVAAGDVVSQSPKPGVSQKEGLDGHTSCCRRGSPT